MAFLDLTGGPCALLTTCYWYVVCSQPCACLAVSSSMWSEVYVVHQSNLRRSGNQYFWVPFISLFVCRIFWVRKNMGWVLSRYVIINSLWEARADLSYTWPALSSLWDSLPPTYLMCPGQDSACKALPFPELTSDLTGGVRPLSSSQDVNKS